MELKKLLSSWSAMCGDLLSSMVSLPLRTAISSILIGYKSELRNANGVSAQTYRTALRNALEIFSCRAVEIRLTRGAVESSERHIPPVRARR